VPEGKAALMFEVMSITENASHESFRGSLRSSSKQVPSNPSPNGVMSFFCAGREAGRGSPETPCPAIYTQPQDNATRGRVPHPPVSAVLSTRRFTSTGYSRVKPLQLTGGRSIGRVNNRRTWSFQWLARPKPRFALDQPGY